jgi:activator of HSP90 ATPase
MNVQRDRDALANGVNRRQAIVGIAAALGGLALISRATAATPDTMAETPATKENQLRTSIHQEVPLKASAQRIYGILLDSEQFTAFTGRPAEIDQNEGGAFALFGGVISGRNVELIPNQRIVQAWRPASWDPGVYSIVKFELVPQGSGTLVVFDHTGFPEGKYDGLLSGWINHYWDPLAKFLA